MKLNKHLFCILYDKYFLYRKIHIRHFFQPFIFKYNMLEWQLINLCSVLIINIILFCILCFLVMTSLFSRLAIPLKNL